jgi:hypothetical protein
MNFLTKHFVRFATRFSTWIVVVSIIITSFSAFPSWPSFLLHSANVLVLLLALVVAHHEGKRIGSKK